MQQIRRRLWHFILLLDSYFAFDRGSETMIRAGSFQRPLPVDLNDEDLVEYSTAATVEISRKRVTDMNFSLLLQELYIVGDRLEALHPRLEPDTWQRRMELTKMHNERIEKQYTRHLDPKIAFQRMTVKKGKIGQAVNLLSCVRSFQRPFPSHDSPPDEALVLELALDVLRKTNDLWTDPEIQKWSRLPWVQWHPLAIVLGSLCTIHNNPLAEEAWTEVDRSVERAALQVADGGKGRLWQPIAKLYRRALALRNLDAQPEVPMGDLDTSLGFQGDPNVVAFDNATKAFGMLMPDTNSPTYDTMSDLSIPTWLITSDFNQWQDWQYPGLMQGDNENAWGTQWPS